MSLAAPLPRLPPSVPRAQIPIVMASGTDQVSLGLAANLSRPGGNVTGLASINSDLMAKRFELLREIAPKMFPAGGTLARGQCSVDGIGKRS